MAPEPFQVSPQEVQRIANTWKDTGDAVNRLKFTPLADAIGEASAVVDALHSVHDPARRATQSIGTRLSDMGQSLAVFDAQTVESDGASAAAFDRLAPR